MRFTCRGCRPPGRARRGRGRARARLRAARRGPRRVGPGDPGTDVWSFRMTRGRCGRPGSPPRSSSTPRPRCCPRSPRRRERSRRVRKWELTVGPGMFAVACHDWARRERTGERAHDAHLKDVDQDVAAHIATGEWPEKPPPRSSITAWSRKSRARTTRRLCSSASARCSPPTSRSCSPRRTSRGSSPSRPASPTWTPAQVGRTHDSPSGCGGPRISRGLRAGGDHEDAGLVAATISNGAQRPRWRLADSASPPGGVTAPGARRPRDAQTQPSATSAGRWVPYRATPSLRPTTGEVGWESGRRAQLRMAQHSPPGARRPCAVGEPRVTLAPMARRSKAVRQRTVALSRVIAMVNDKGGVGKTSWLPTWLVSSPPRATGACSSTSIAKPTSPTTSATATTTGMTRARAC